MHAHVDDGQEVGGCEVVQSGAAAVGVGAADHNVGVEQFTEDVLVAHVSEHPQHGRPEAELVDMPADDVDFGWGCGCTEIVGRRAYDPSDVRGGVE